MEKNPSEIDKGAMLLYHQDEYNRIRQLIRSHKVLGMDTKALEGQCLVHRKLINKLRGMMRNSENYKTLKR